MQFVCTYNEKCSSSTGFRDGSWTLHFCLPAGDKFSPGKRRLILRYASHDLLTVTGGRLLARTTVGGRKEKLTQYMHACVLCVCMRVC